MPNATHVQVGDTIVLWDGTTLLGLSVIEAIATGEGTKDLSSCPTCGKADIAERKTTTPRYRCWASQCKAQFDNPAIKGKNPTPLDVVDNARRVIAEGHKIRTARVRNGQAAFRARLLEQFGEVCAFLGRTPAAALEAAHLYSYAGTGKHYTHGGLLLRRDVHRLFDLGQIAIEPESQTLDIAPGIRTYPDYGKLHGQRVAVPLTKAHQKWIIEHWAIHRGSSVFTTSEHTP